MSLFADDPITLATRDFTFRCQLPDNKSIVGEWIEPAASINAESKLVVKHDESAATLRRRLLQHRINKETSLAEMKPITVNITVTYDKNHVESDVSDAFDLAKAAVATAGFTAAFMDGQIR